MQLPRGTFREIRKKVSLEDLLRELGQTGFTGTCGIVAGPATGTFVFLSGSCILAKFRGRSGDAGLDEMDRCTGEAVDVILSTLDDAQIKLSLEFNPTCRTTVGSTGFPPRAVPATRRPADGAIFGPLPARHPVHQARPHQQRPVITSESPATATPHRVPPGTDASGNLGPQKGGATAVPDDFETDIAALDTMDLDLVTSRIRSDCKTLVRKLELEHLMER